jgi:hypothetical protein
MQIMRICQAMNGFIYSNRRHLPYGKGEKQRTTKPIHINISQKSGGKRWNIE